MADTNAETQDDADSQVAAAELQGGEGEVVAVAVLKLLHVQLTSVTATRMTSMSTTTMRN